MNFRDIEDSIKSFDGTKTYPVEKWIQEIEDMSELMHWTELHTFIFARKKLCGLAKTLIESERGVKTWKVLKGLLKREFTSKLNSANLHRMLSEKRLKPNQNVLEYFLEMKELAGRGTVEDEALIQYVIDGIQDYSSNKIVLLGAVNLREFKTKLKVYCDLREKTSSRNDRRFLNKTPQTNFKSSSYQESARPKTSGIRCFNCGIMGHKSSDCQQKKDGAKCFRCNKFGHKSYECQQPRTGDDSKPALNQPSGMKKISSVINPNKIYKSVTIDGIEFTAFIDIGSDVHLISENAFSKIKSFHDLEMSDITLAGFGGSKIKAVGEFTCDMIIDAQSIKSTAYVCPNEVMAADEFIIGNKLLDHVEMHISRKEGLKLKKLHDETEEEEKCIRKIDAVVDQEELDIGHEVKGEIKNKIELLLRDYTPIKTKTTNIEMKIIVKDENPVYYSPRRLPFAERNIVDEQIERWIEDGIVEPCSSEYASQVVVVKKKCGSPRICIDYRKINKVIVKDRFPLPLIEDQLDRLQDAKIFTTLDLKNGFFHVPIEKESRHYTAFVTHKGQYQFLKVPFGLCNSPAVFQRFINTVFRDLINEGIALQYMDDLIIPASNENEALERLRIVLRTAEEYGLEINRRKCQFLKRSVEFLGHRIENGKIYPSTEKTRAVMRFPEPKTVKQIQSFLGLTGYFRKFIPFYSSIAKPLSDLLKKERQFKFEEKEKQAFNELKKMLSEKPVLSIFKQGAEMELHTDASADGYGAILFQRSYEDNQLHPIYYVSRKTTDAERKYSSYELEVLAIIEALKKLRVYLLGSRFKIITDCSAFEKTMNKKDLCTRVARWALLLEEFDYTIQHRSGEKMKHVDALSRYPVMKIEADSFALRLQRAQKEDVTLKVIIDVLQEKPYEDYFLKNGILFRMVKDEERLVVPSNMENEIIRKAHEEGHFSIKKTEEIIKQEYYIPKLKEKIEKIISSCVPCILANRKRGKQEGYLHPLSKDDIPLQTYHVDHLGPLESTNKNYKHIFAVIDGFTKFVWLYPVKSTTTKEVIAKLNLQQTNFGNPKNLVSDRGTAFTSEEFQNYCDENKINHRLITTGLPRANGQIERLNSVIISVLSKLCADEPGKWYKYVDQVQRLINSTYHRSINTTPFELLTGVKMRNKTDLRIKVILEEELRKDFEEGREERRLQAKKQIDKIQDENRRTYNLKRKPCQKYRIDDLVAVKRTQLGPGLKLKPKYLGPYKIVNIKGRDTYDVVKVGFHDGPVRTSTCAEHMKPWYEHEDECTLTSPETCDPQDGRVVGTQPNHVTTQPERALRSDDAMYSDLGPDDDALKSNLHPALAG